MKMKRNKHDDRLEEMVKNPRVIGVKNPVLACQNVMLYNDKQVHGEIDLLIFDAFRGWIKGEYKSNDKHRLKGMEQLIGNLRYMRQECIIDNAELLYIHGQMEVVNIGKKR